MWQLGSKRAAFLIGTPFPQRCVRCNQPSVKTMDGQVAWYPKWIWFLLIVGLMPAIILGMLLRKTARVNYGLCQSHLDSHMLGLGVLLLGACTPLMAFFVKDSAIVMGIFLTFPFVILAGALMRQHVTAKHVGERVVIVSAGQPFIASLPIASPQVVSALEADLPPSNQELTANSTSMIPNADGPALGATVTIRRGASHLTGTVTQVRSNQYKVAFPDGRTIWVTPADLVS